MNIIEFANSALLPAYPAGAINVKASGGTDDLTLADRFGQRLNLKDFGAKGDGVTDDSAAWQAACTAANAFIDAAAWPEFPRGRSVLYVPPGNYLINTGAALSDCNFKISADKNTVSFTLAAAQYLLVVTSSVYWFECVDALRVYDGAGAFKFTKTGVNVWNGINISGNDFVGYTECAIAVLSSDFPYKTIERNFFYGSSSLTSKGIVFAGDSTRSAIRNNRFLCNRYHMKLVESNMLISDNDFIRYVAGGGSPVLVDIWFTGSSTQPTSNQNCVLQNNKFGNEGFSSGDIRILLADEGSGTNYIDKNHATTVSTRWHNGLTFRDNHHANVGGALRGMIYAYMSPGYLTGLVVDDALPYTYPYVVECDAVVAASGSANTYTKNGVIIGRTPGIDFQKNKPIPVSNRLHAHTVHDLVGMLGTSEQISTPYPSGAVARYARILSSSGETLSSWTTSSASVSAITDARGGQNAYTVTATGSSGNVQRGLVLGNIIVGELAWIEIDLKKSGTLPVSHAAVSVRDNVGAVFHTQTFELGTNWRTVRFPWVPGQNAAALSLSVDVVGYSAGVATNYDIGCPRVYHAQTPVSRDTNALANSKTWDPASIANGASATTTVTVTGATLGDFVVPSFSLSLGGLSLSAYVSATDTVTVVLTNNTGGPVDLGSGTLYVKVLRNLG